MQEWYDKRAAEKDEYLKINHPLLWKIKDILSKIIGVFLLLYIGYMFYGYYTEYNSKPKSPNTTLNNDNSSSVSSNYTDTDIISDNNTTNDSSNDIISSKPLIINDNNLSSTMGSSYNLVENRE
jgi:hypothetical protein